MSTNVSVLFLSLWLIISVNGLSSEQLQSSGSDDIDSRLTELELAVSKLQSENVALKEQLNIASDAQQNATTILSHTQLETNVSLLQGSILELQNINVNNQQKLIRLQDELWASRNESGDLRVKVSMLHWDIATITMQFVDMRHNLTKMQHSITQLVENITLLLNKSPMDGATKLAELMQIGSTLQSLMVTMENKQSQLESVVSGNNSLIWRRLDELDQSFNTSTVQQMKKDRKQDRQIKKMNKVVTDLKQQVDTLSVNNTMVTAGM